MPLRKLPPEKPGDVHVLYNGYMALWYQDSQLWPGVPEQVPCELVRRPNDPIWPSTEHDDELLAKLLCWYPFQGWIATVGRAEKVQIKDVFVRGIHHDGTNIQSAMITAQALVDGERYSENSVLTESKAVFVATHLDERGVRKILLGRDWSLGARSETEKRFEIPSSALHRMDRDECIFEAPITFVKLRVHPGHHLFSAEDMDSRLHKKYPEHAVFRNSPEDLVCFLVEPRPDSFPPHVDSNLVWPPDLWQHDERLIVPLADAWKHVSSPASFTALFFANLIYGSE